MNISEIEAIYNAGCRKLHVTYNTGEKETIRIFRSTHGTICRFKRKSQKYGYELNPTTITNASPVVPKKNNEQKWIDGWKKVQERITESQLWSDIKEDITIALKVGYARMNKAYEDYWKIEGYDYTKFAEAYPELVFRNDKDVLCINTSILWTYAKLPKVKKMRFVQNLRHYENGQDPKLLEIAKCMEAKQECHVSGDNGYDVSFEYRPDINKAWYSEEYRNCGNGHYYIALNATHALFMEDD